MAKKFTEEEKNAVLARASEIGVRQAAKEAGVSFQTVYKWSNDAAVEKIVEDIQVSAIATDIEVKEKAAKTSRKAKDKVKNAKLDAVVKEEEIKDVVDATKIESKKKTRSAGRKVKEKAQETKEKVKETIEKPVKKAKAAKVDIIFETNGGRQITPEAITEIVPKGCDAAYVKLEENKIYWVKGTETGSLDIWE